MFGGRAESEPSEHTVPTKDSSAPPPAPTPAPPPCDVVPYNDPPPSLVGAIIAFNSRTYTVVDDSAPEVAIAVACAGRATITVTDDAGVSAPLHVGFDTRGAVIEAATTDQWGEAEVIG